MFVLCYASKFSVLMYGRASAIISTDFLFLFVCFFASFWVGGPGACRKMNGTFQAEMFKQGVTAGDCVIFTHLKPIQYLISGPRGRQKICDCWFNRNAETVFLSEYHFHQYADLNIITRTNEDRQKNDGFLFLLNTLSHSDMNANSFFYYYSLHLRCLPATSWPWVTDPH